MPVLVRLDRLPPDQRHTRPDPYNNEHGRLKCVPAAKSILVAPCCVYIALAAAALLVEGSISVYRKYPY